ncbi:MAG: hypothetical protein ABIW76_13255, partial [Fibrobacteria bacterium]
MASNRRQWHNRNKVFSLGTDKNLGFPVLARDCSGKMGIIEPNHLSLGFVEALYADYLKDP